jgi:hypothetical protein
MKLMIGNGMAEACHKPISCCYLQADAALLTTAWPWANVS